MLTYYAGCRPAGLLPWMTPRQAPPLLVVVAGAVCSVVFRDIRLRANLGILHSESDSPFFFTFAGLPSTWKFGRLKKSIDLLFYHFCAVLSLPPQSLYSS